MPKLGRPFFSLLKDLEENSKVKQLYFLNGISEVQRKAPFGTNYTPDFLTKIVGSKYRKIEEESGVSARLGVFNFPNGLKNNFFRNCLSQLSNQDENAKTINNRPILPPILSERERNYNLAELVSMLPPGKDLPNKSITLRNYEQISLINLTKNEICDIPDFIDNLKRIYLMLAKIDINLTGLCTFKEFIDACYHNNVHISLDLLRVISSLFIVSSRDDVQFVNYEKPISFLGAIYNNFQTGKISPTRNQSSMRESHRESSEHPLYFHDEDCIDLQSTERIRDSRIPIDETELIKKINDDVGFYPIPIQRIRLSCQRNDSFHRGTLSAKQLEEICLSENLTLKKSTFEKLLQKSKYMGGGQYNWQTFVDFLEKVQPINTGLQIPSSKMPLDYVKQIPAPASSWPHSEPPDIHHDMRGSYSDLRIPNIKYINKQDFSQQHTPASQTYVNTNNMNYNSGRISTNNYSKNTTVIDEPSHEEPWFNKFLKFVDLIYIKDVNSRGILPTKELFEISTVLNQKLGLDFTTTELISALDGSSVDHSNQFSNINSFLKRLSIRSTK